MTQYVPMRALLAAGCAALALSAQPAAAQTLAEALAATYENNPTITATRSGLRALDENVPIARADGRPNVGGTVNYDEQLLAPSNSFFSPDRQVNVRGQVSVPIYSGGSVRNSIRAAEARVDGGQANLRATESSIFSQVVGAYMDVLRDEAVVALNRNNVQVLSVNATATQDRFDIGDLTRTDVAQSQARLATARSQLETAESRLINSREQYVRLVGAPPVALQTPPALPGLPANVAAAVETALAENPDIEAAQTEIMASRLDVRAVQGTRMPRVALTTSGGYTDYLGSNAAGTSANATSATAGVAVTIPLYQGGRPAARVRQAQARESQAIEQAIGVERSVIAQTRAAYAIWQASNAVAASSAIAVEANRLSLEGVRAENSVGTRSILDILNAEQELLNAQVQLVSARRDAYVAGFSVLAAMGRAEAEDLGLGGGTLYDPQTNYDRVRGRFSDWNDDPQPVPVATRTADTQPQTATVSSGDTPVLARDPR